MMLLRNFYEHRVWSYGLYAIIAVLGAVVIIQPTGPSGLAMFLLSCCCALLALKHPVISCVAFAFLFLLVAWEPTLRNFGTILGAVFAVGVLAYHARFQLAALFTAVFIVLGHLNFTRNPILSIELASVGIIVALYAVGLVIGGFVGLSERRHQAAQLKAEQEARLRKEAAVRTLHDSVASSLTSVVMRSEGLLFEQELKPEYREAVGLISEDTRRAMEEVRTLIRLIDEDDWGAQAVLNSQGTLKEFSSMLTSHGFELEVDGPQQVVTDMSETFPNMGTLLRELATNIIKYADRDHIVRISLAGDTKEDDFLTMEIENECAQMQPQVHLSSGLGLKELEEDVSKEGGQLDFGYAGSQWRVRLALPAR